jgi:hypothetical protein
MDANPPITSRSDLMSLLTEACELEHGLACSYLYSAFTMKQSVYESDLTWQQFQFTRKWAGQLYFIASQEMLHLSQVWNLLTAIGGTPYYMRPNFPQSHKYYPIGLPLKLEPFSRKALKRFTFYELPSVVSDVEFLEKEFGIKSEKVNKAFTVGKLYQQIKNAFSGIPEKELFIGNPALQVGPGVGQFNELVRVSGRSSADAGIHTIMEQGEGNPKDEVDCHYGLYVKIDIEYDQLEKEAREAGNPFRPSRNTIDNPISSLQKNIGPSQANPITDPFTDQVAVFFDNVYSLMLRMLQYVFQSGPLPDSMQAQLADMAIQLMTRSLKPIGEALTLLPAAVDNRYEGKTAGPCFGLYRHVSLPADPGAALAVMRDRFVELIESGKRLALNKKAPQPLVDGIAKLESIASPILKRPAPSAGKKTNALP